MIVEIPKLTGETARKFIDRIANPPLPEVTKQEVEIYRSMINKQKKK